MDATAWAQIEQWRQEGWLVSLKCMPDGRPFLAGDDWLTDPKLYTRYLCELSWVSVDTAEDCSRRLWISPTGWGETMAIAVQRAGTDLARLESRYVDEARHADH